MRMPDHDATFRAALVPDRLIFNGKFLSAGPTGVHRVAEELLRALDALLAEGGHPGPELLCPRGVRRLPLARIRQREVGLTRWIPWEQVELPLHARDGLIVNLCNLGPLAAPRAVTLIHDAQVHLTPRSYSRAFRLWYRLCLPILGRRARRVLTVSNFSRDQLAAHGIAPRERITVIPNGVDHILRTPADPAARRRLGLDPGRYACALANTQPHKNIPLLLKAFARPELRHLHLVLIGEADAEAFRRRGHPPPPNACFAGRIPDPELRGLVEGALAFLCPSLTEGFGLPPLEAMALGTPAIVAPEGALPEVCAEAALYAAADAPAAWAASLRRLADDPAHRADYGRRGPARAERYTWRAAALALLAAIAEASPRQPGPRA
jgi:glycosyltransferase involved in cell wall biosynthesis